MIPSIFVLTSNEPRAVAELIASHYGALVAPGNGDLVVDTTDGRIRVEQNDDAVHDLAGYTVDVSLFIRPTERAEEVGREIVAMVWQHGISAIAVVDYDSDHVVARTPDVAAE